MKLEPIDTSTTAGKASVMQLAAEGRRVVEASLVRGPLNSFYSKWSETSLPIWDWSNRRYAIIAQPVGPDEVWVELHEDGGIAAVYAAPPIDCEQIGAVRYRRVEE